MDDPLTSGFEEYDSLHEKGSTEKVDEEDGHEVEDEAMEGRESQDELGEQRREEDSEQEHAQDLEHKEDEYIKREDTPNDRPDCCALAAYIQTIPSTDFFPKLDTEIQLLRNQRNPIVTITETIKQSDMSGTSFTAYVVVADFGSRFESKHRYTDFENLKLFLENRYSWILVPTIPEKHKVSDYASKPGKAKQDPTIIEIRKRSLQMFLNRCLGHEQLSKCHELHLFLKGELNFQDSIRRKHDIGMMKSLRKPDAIFTSKMDVAVRFGTQLAFIKKIHSKIISLYLDMTNTFLELGALYNGWSLSETVLSECVEQMGQAVDSNLTAINVLQKSLDERMGDWIREYSRFNQSVISLLNRRQKIHVKFELVSEALVTKQTFLAKLEQSEHESQRLTAILAVEGPSIPMSRPSGFMAQLNALIDSDPDTTRRTTISRTRDLINQLENQREDVRNSLLDLNAKLKQELEVYEDRKREEMKDLRLALAVIMREFHRRALSAWKGAKEAIEGS